MIVWVASVLALLFAAFSAYSAITDQLVLLPLAAVPLMAGFGILRRRAWSAYGFSLFLFSQLILLGLSVLRPGGAASWQTGAAVALLLIVIALYLAAGRSLAATGGKRGRAWPWIAVSALMTAPFLFFQPFLIPTGAMEDTLAVGDRILVRRYPRPAVTRGDLVVFTSPVDRRQTYVKRVIGMPGDRIRISNKVVIRNGKPLREPYAVHKTEYIDLYRDNFPAQPEPPVAEHAREVLARHVDNGELVVPAGKYFVLGDNRDNSLDSRYWGFVDAADLLGEPVVIYSSISGGAHGNYPFKLL